MTRRFPGRMALFFLALLLAACAPAAVPTFDQAGETVQIDPIPKAELGRLVREREIEGGDPE